jgi:hypothetical protein
VESSHLQGQRWIRVGSEASSTSKKKKLLRRIRLFFADLPYVVSAQGTLVTILPAQEALRVYSHALERPPSQVALKVTREVDPESRLILVVRLAGAEGLQPKLTCVGAYRRSLS